MLDITLSTTVKESLWNRLESHAALLCEETEYLSDNGATPLTQDSRRRYRRIKLRGRVIVRLADELIGGYTSDISPLGIGFISPIQFYPRDEVQLLFEEFPALVLIVRRCQRLAENSYSCGGDFLCGPMNPSCYKQLLQALQKR